MSESENLRFLPEHYFVKEGIILACRNVLGRPTLRPDEAYYAACILWLAMRLPQHHSEYSGTLSVTIEYPDAYGSRSVRIGGGGLELETAEGFNTGCGWDHESRTEFEVTTDGFREGPGSACLEEWLYTFARRCGDPAVKLSLEWYPDDALPPLDDLPDCDPWDLLWAEDE